MKIVFSYLSIEYLKTKILIWLTRSSICNKTEIFLKLKTLLIKLYFSQYSITNLRDYILIANNSITNNTVLNMKGKLYSYFMHENSTNKNQICFN